MVYASCFQMLGATKHEAFAVHMRLSCREVDLASGEDVQQFVCFSNRQVQTLMKVQGGFAG